VPLVTSIPPGPEGPERILIVDDDEARRRLFGTFLGKSGYHVDDLDSGEALLDTARRVQPDLVLMDIMLPGRSGIELTRELRADRDLGRTPVILMTAGLDDEQSIVNGLACGADDYVVTPIGLQELHARIRVQLRNQRDRQLLRWAFEQRRQFKDESRKDPLTGVANRRAGEEALATALEAGSVALAMVDLDHFKRINDTFGHPAGDAVLMAVAGALERSLRERGTVARFGGEEFAVIAPNEADPVALGEQLRAAVAALEFPDDVGIREVTASVGVADSARAPGADGAALIAAADRALYRAKATGRDRVVIADLAG
jgi:two-component system, cell cycle response regulator